MNRYERALLRERSMLSYTTIPMLGGHCKWQRLDSDY